MKTDQKNRVLLAISSGGGHLEQLMLCRPGFDGVKTHYVSTLDGVKEQFKLEEYTKVDDFNRNNISSIFRSAIQINKIISLIKPDIIITTGAAPGLLALVIGKFYGIHLIWIDSIANSEKISLSGRIAKYVATVRITQWPHLVSSRSIRYMGSVL